MATGCCPIASIRAACTKLRSRLQKPTQAVTYSLETDSPVSQYHIYTVTWDTIRVSDVSMSRSLDPGSTLVHTMRKCSPAGLINGIIGGVLVFQSLILPATFLIFLRLAFCFSFMFYCSVSFLPPLAWFLRLLRCLLFVIVPSVTVALIFRSMFCCSAASVYSFSLSLSLSLRPSLSLLTSYFLLLWHLVPSSLSPVVLSFLLAFSLSDLFLFLCLLLLIFLHPICFHSNYALRMPG